MGQHERRESLKHRAIPNMPATPTPESCHVEMLADEVLSRGDCRRSLSGCALCTLSGLTCDEIVAIGMNE